ncbi:MAG: HAD family hydrolase [Verrucomicrobiae bacterium]|nr:HAD family hydrolase [Verrucomicrobiae bacterium]
MTAAAFFDMDGTLLRGESQLSFLLWCLKTRRARLLRSSLVFFRYAAYVAGLTKDARRLRDAGFDLFQGTSATELAEFGQQFFDGCMSRRIRSFASKLLDSHRRNGHAVILVTSALESLAMPLANFLGIEFVVATRLMEQGGVLTGARETPEPYGSGKRQLIEQLCVARGYAPERCYAYGDHISDVELLSWVGHPVVVNPTQRLARVARERHWRILDLERGIPRELIDW